MKKIPSSTIVKISIVGLVVVFLSAWGLRSISRSTRQGVVPAPVNPDKVETSTVTETNSKTTEVKKKNDPPKKNNGELKILRWDAMAKLNLKTGEAPQSLKEMDGQSVRIPGFIVPLEDEAQEISEFLLVPYQGACVHVPPPPPNQMVHVKMQGRNVRYTFEPIWITGVLSISNSQSPYGVVSFNMKGVSTAAFQRGSY